MPRSLFVPVVLLTAALVGACGNDSTPTGPTTTPVAITEPPFTGTLTVNGAATFPFAVNQTGTITATLTALSTDGAVVGFELGTWNATTSTCTVATIANDQATAGATIIGNAASTANFCVRIFDVGKLTAPTDYVITVTHF
jgi:hypothetical protein